MSKRNCGSQKDSKLKGDTQRQARRNRKVNNNGQAENKEENSQTQKSGSQLYERAEEVKESRSKIEHKRRRKDRESMIVDQEELKPAYPQDPEARSGPQKVAQEDAVEFDRCATPQPRAGALPD
eukprot:CAMPEP_0185591696 /NCGR_PEP_ID=MMETSP0434-20130131/65400_1 /TAXON_ID=626734 ORGANISM="Favella taraikaensis, Strain Fe Narragansett Bay" /NCGR_SAMPLE_ID=MMETSP0434 /ASSEMBLY_ACC=CAM_ASM_000379 /LENGTH=123 /DNA_ID=CAMNT_0028216905 /DNA_START=864 /DNA_END=1234 /DNA_ORIENTATION=+